jgi:hypothetical protein
MKRQDWKLVAKTLATCRPSRKLLSEWAHWRLTVERLATAFEGDNPEFDPIRFRRDCGLSAGEEFVRS